MSISRVFDIARRSMAVYQRSIDVTAHNVANSSNPDYSRQRILFGTENSQVLSGFVWGSGVKIDMLQRVRDQMTDSQIRINNNKLFQHTQHSAIMGQLEKLFSEPSQLGLSNLTTEFFNAWNELSVNPTSIPLRGDVIRAAEKIAAKVKYINDGMDTLRSEILNESRGKVTQLNGMLKELQSINKQIFESTSVGLSPNDLLDRRDKIIDDLSKLANITVTYDSANMANVSIGGVFAADKSFAAEFKISEVNGRLTLSTISGDNTATINGGELYGLFDNFSTNIPNYRDRLNSIITSMMNAINGEHSTGYSITDPPLTGINFFEGFQNGILTINPDIIADPRYIAVSSDGTNGNGSIAMKIFELSTKKLNNGMTILDSYSGLISELGSSKQNADSLAEANSLILMQLEQQKASYSGVSIDEEMTNLIRFQRSYEASAKLIRVADDMLETLLGLVR